MITVEKLREYGADVSDGLGRCMNNEGFYLTLVSLLPKEKGFDELQQAIEENDLSRAFEAAHSLKGVLGNLSITPLYRPLSEITELLRARREANYPQLLKEINEEKERFFRLFE